MQSRMEKYQSRNKNFERSKKNAELYESVYDDIYRQTSYKNMSVIDSAKEIDLGNLKNILDDKYDIRQYRTLKNYNQNDYDIDEMPDFTDRESKIYDINQIISDAKDRRTFLEEEKEKQKIKEKLEEYYNYQLQLDEEEAEDDLDLFGLKGEDNTIVTKPISDDSFEKSFDTDELSSNVSLIKSSDEEFINDDEELEDVITKDIEKTLVKADKTFYTDSNMFTKNDFDDTLRELQVKKSPFKKIIIIIIVIAILAVLGYFVASKYIVK